MYIVLNVMNAMLGVFNAVWQEEKVTEEVGTGQEGSGDKADAGFWDEFQSEVDV